MFLAFLRSLVPQTLVIHRSDYKFETTKTRLRPLVSPLSILDLLLQKSRDVGKEVGLGTDI